MGKQSASSLAANCATFVRPEKASPSAILQVFAGYPWAKFSWEHDSYFDPSALDVKLVPHMGVSKNIGTPKSSILIGFSIINHPFWGINIFGNIHIDLNSFHAAFFKVDLVWRRLHYQWCCMTFFAQAQDKSSACEMATMTRNGNALGGRYMMHTRQNTCLFDGILLYCAKFVIYGETITPIGDGTPHAMKSFENLPGPGMDRCLFHSWSFDQVVCLDVSTWIMLKPLAIRPSQNTAANFRYQLEWWDPRVQWALNHLKLMGWSCFDMFLYRCSKWIQVDGSCFSGL